MKIKITFYFVLLCLCSNSCQDRQSNITQKTTDITFLGIKGKLPQGWSFQLRKNSIDSELGYFLSNKNDTIFIEKGFYANTLTEPDIKVLPASAKNQMKEEYLFDKSIVFVPDSIFSQQIDLDEYREQNVEFIDIDGAKCKLTFPRKEKGITGCYFNNIGITNNGKLKLSVYGKNLSKEEKTKFIEFIRSFNFQKNPQ